MALVPARPSLVLETHGDTKSFWTRKAETPQSLQSRWCSIQSRTRSSSDSQQWRHGAEQRGDPSPKRLRLQGRWVSAVTTAGSL